MLTDSHCLQSMHWADPKQKIQSLPEPKTMSTIAHGNPSKEEQDMTLGPSEKSKEIKSEVNVQQDDKVSSLHQFRKGMMFKPVMCLV